MKPLEDVDILVKWGLMHVDVGNLAHMTFL